MREEMALSPGGLDELSVLSYLRTLPGVSGSPVRVGVYASQKNWEGGVKVRGRKTLKTMLGRRGTLVVKPLAMLTRRDIGDFQASLGATGRLGR